MCRERSRRPGARVDRRFRGGAHSRLQLLISETAQVYQGLWGTAPFQRIYSSAPTTLAALLFRPEWYLVGLTLAGLALSTDGALQRISSLLCVTFAVIPLVSIATAVARTPF